MNAAWMVARSDLRRRWRSIVAVTLAVGVIGAVVLATVAGARRTATSLDRFNTASRSSDIEITAGFPSAAQLQQLARVRDVRTVARSWAFFATFPAVPNLFLGAAADEVIGHVVDRPRVIEGRDANPSAVDEITVNETLARKLHRRVGGHLDGLSYTPVQAKRAFDKGDPGGPPEGPRLRFRIVGITRRPLDLGVRGASGGVLLATPAFARSYERRIGVFAMVVRIRTRHGAADVPRVTAAAKRILADPDSFDAQTLAIETEGARSAIGVLGDALWILAGIAAFAGIVTVAIVLSREVDSASVDDPTLLALGLTRPQRVVSGGMQAFVVGVGGAVLACAGAALASPLFPFGIARRAEPHPGLHVDVAVLLLGGLGIAITVLAITLVAAIRATRRSSAEHAARARRRPSVIVQRAARAGLAPSTTNGLRMALEPGRGRTAVPVRSAFVASALGVLGVVTVFTFAAGLRHLVATPQQYGWTWDVAAQIGDDDGGIPKLNGVGAVATAAYTNIEVDGRPTIGWGFGSLRSRIDPDIVAGRAPRHEREIALGSRTLRQIGKHVGDTVRAAGPKGTAAFRIVGRVALPTLVDPQPLAESAVFTTDGYHALVEPKTQNQTKFVLLRFARGADRAALTRAIAAKAPPGSLPRRTLPPEVARIRDVGWLPIALAVLLAGLGALGVGHALVTAVRRRRRDLALLKTLGFVRGQVRATIAWQATTLAVVGLVLGIPIGLVLGRLVWRLVADNLGVSPAFTTPAIAVLVTVPAALVLTNLVALVPARVAARRPIAGELRDE